MSRIDSQGKSHEHEPADATADAGDERLVARAREVLLESIDSLDGQTRSRLTQARHAALEQLESGGLRHSVLARWLVPAGGLAAAALVALLWFDGRGLPAIDSPTGGLTAGTDAAERSTLDNVANDMAEDIVLMADADSLELLQEIEFYVWLDAEAALPPVAAGGVG